MLEEFKVSKVKLRDTESQIHPAPTCRSWRFRSIQLADIGICLNWSRYHFGHSFVSSYIRFREVGEIRIICLCGTERWRKGRRDWIGSLVLMVRTTDPDPSKILRTTEVNVCGTNLNPAVYFRCDEEWVVNKLSVSLTKTNLKRFGSCNTELLLSWYTNYENGFGIRRVIRISTAQTRTKLQCCSILAGRK